MPEPRVFAVEGLAELQRAFSKLNKDLAGGIHEALEAAGEPVRQDASGRALGEISGMPRGRLPWHTMRIGVTRHSVYVAPLMRGTKSRTLRSAKRRNLARLLLDRAMIPAVHANSEKVEDEMLETLDDLFRAWERL